MPPVGRFFRFAEIEEREAELAAAWQEHERAAVAEAIRATEERMLEAMPAALVAQGLHVLSDADLAAVHKAAGETAVAEYKRTERKVTTVRRDERGVIVGSVSEVMP